jgi:hypothetical protein
VIVAHITPPHQPTIVDKDDSLLQSNEVGITCNHCIHSTTNTYNSVLLPQQQHHHYYQKKEHNHLSTLNP